MMALAITSRQEGATISNSICFADLDTLPSFTRENGEVSRAEVERPGRWEEKSKKGGWRKECNVRR